MVHGGREGAVARKLQRDYWKKNVQTWRDAKSPSLAAADIDISLEPARGTVSSRGTYTLVNLTRDTLSQVGLTGGLFWKNVRWTMAGDSAKPENRAGLYVFKPGTPLAPGDRLEIGYAFDGRFPDGISKNGRGAMEYVLPAAAVLTGFSDTAMGPIVGYMPERGVEHDKNESDPREYPDDYWKRTLPGALPMFSAWSSTRIRVTSPAAYQHNATGSLVSESVASGKRVTEWKSDSPVRAFNVVLGKWQVKRRDGVAVFYAAQHPYNVDEMLDALAAARKWYGEWFAPYPWKELRLSEFPGLATYAQGPPTNITFSENIGFLTKSEPKANAAFWITAHEAAHQWWPCMAMPGEGPGGDVLSEGMAHFSTILLTEQARGLEQRMAFCRSIEDRYGNTRQRDSERPLTKVDGSLPGDRRIIYDRGGFVFWMLHELMGREASFAALKEYMALYRDSEDHPLIEDYLAVLRRHAPDLAAFDAYTKQWFFGTVVPQFLFTDAKLVKAGREWEVRAKVKNIGTGDVTVEVGVIRGERFPKERTKENAWSDARTTVTLGAGEEKPLTIRCAFEPERLVMDPDVRLLMLERQKSERRLKVSKDPQTVAMAGR
jgi:ABC-2 type transport system permease protein